MLGRGRRLDESKPGSGLGLSIVADLATLYRGRFRLEQAALGGLRAVLEVPGDAARGRGRALIAGVREQVPRPSSPRKACHREKLA